jgi:hypothetical protein
MLCSAASRTGWFRIALARDDVSGLSSSAVCHMHTCCYCCAPSRDLTRSGSLHTTTRGCRLDRYGEGLVEGDTGIKDDGNLG